MGQCALVFETRGEETTYFFLYALQCPMLVALLPLTKTELVLPALASLDSALLETLAGTHHNTYKMCTYGPVCVGFRHCVAHTPMST